MRLILSILSGALGIALVMLTVPAFDMLASKAFEEGGTLATFFFLAFLFLSGFMFLILGIILWRAHRRQRRNEHEL